MNTASTRSSMMAMVALLGAGAVGPGGVAPILLEPVRRAVACGRNEPCPCGSGRKYKRCCRSDRGAGTRTASS